MKNISGKKHLKYLIKLTKGFIIHLKVLFIALQLAVQETQRLVEKYLTSKDQN